MDPDASFSYVHGREQAPRLHWHATPAVCDLQMSGAQQTWRTSIGMEMRRATAAVRMVAT